MSSLARVSTAVALALGLAVPANAEALTAPVPPLPVGGCTLVVEAPVERAECTFVYQGGGTLRGVAAGESNVIPWLTVHRPDDRRLPGGAGSQTLFTPWADAHLLVGRYVASSVEPGTVLTCRVSVTLDFPPGPDHEPGEHHFGPGVAHCGHQALQ